MGWIFRRKSDSTYRHSDIEILQSYHLTDLRFTSHPKEAVADLENRYAILGFVEDEKT